MEFYYGLPQMIWDDLCSKAEDLLQEEQLGNHLVGVYPAGNRIYGIESASPGLLCLYVDSVESILDPFSNYMFDEGFKVYHVGESNSPIIMVDIFKWVHWLWSRNCDWKAACFLHAIPFGRHCIYQDSSISDIMAAAYKAMKEIDFMLSVHLPCDKVTQDSIYPNPYLYYRTMTNLYNNHTFLPNINPEWDEVVRNDTLKDGILVRLLLNEANLKVDPSDYIVPGNKVGRAHV